MTLDTYADLFDDDLNAVADRLNDAATFSGMEVCGYRPLPLTYGSASGLGSGRPLSGGNARKLRFQECIGRKLGTQLD